MSKQSPQKNYRWNFTVNLLDGATYWFGGSFISASTILPLFISKLTNSLWPIGLLSVITSAGWFLPQLFAARITERFEIMKKIVVGWGFFLERLPVWGMVLSAVVARRSPNLALILFFICLAWYGLGAGVVAPSWMGLLAKIFSPEKRGSFMGITMFIGVGMGALGSGVSAWLLETYQFPNSFIGLFIIAAAFMTLSWIFLALTREPSGQADTLDQDWREYWKGLLNILKSDHNFRRFIISTVFLTLGGMGTGFVTISAIQKFQVSDATVGFYTLMLLIGQTVGNLVLGWMADKYGHKLSVEIGALAVILAFILSMVMPAAEYYFAVYFLLGIQLSSGIVSGILVILEFCETSRVPTYSGLANTIRGLFSLIAPLIATEMARGGYWLLFAVSAFVSTIGLVLMFVWVREPRWDNSSFNQTIE